MRAVVINIVIIVVVVVIVIVVVDDDLWRLYVDDPSVSGWAVEDEQPFRKHTVDFNQDLLVRVVQQDIGVVERAEVWILHDDVVINFATLAGLAFFDHHKTAIVVHGGGHGVRRGLNRRLIDFGRFLGGAGLRGTVGRRVLDNNEFAILHPRVLRR